MSKSLQDQLRELGLAREKPPARQRQKPAAPERNKAGKRNSAARPAATGSPVAGRDISLEKAYALRAREEQRAQALEKQRKLEAERERRRINQQIRAIVEPNRKNHAEADLPRYFLFKDRIRKVHVTAEQLAEINAGNLGVVYLSGGYHLLPADLVEQVRQLSAEHVPELGGSDEGLEDDGVPDDLVW